MTDLEATDPLSGGELGLITRDLAARTGAETGLVAILAPDRTTFRIASSWGIAYEAERPATTRRPGGPGFVDRVLESGQAVLEVIDPGEDPSLGVPVSGARLRYAGGAPLRAPGRPMGALCVGFATVPRHEDRPLVRWLIERYAGLAALYVHDASVLEGLLTAARLDGLTGCLNHTAIRSELYREISRCAHTGRPLSCCFIDLDRFKQINDNEGHLHGSQVLAEVAGILRNGVRLGDTLGRYGGDEFLAILPGAAEAASVALAERLRSAVSTAKLKVSSVGVGASIGVAEARPGFTAEDLLAAADDALRAAKRAGGGRVVAASAVATLRDDDRAEEG